MDQLSDTITLDNAVDNTNPDFYLLKNSENTFENQILFETEFSKISKITIDAGHHISISPCILSGINEVFLIASGDATLISQDTTEYITLGSKIVTEDLLSTIYLKSVEELILLKFTIPIGLSKNQSEGKRVSIRASIDDYQVISRGSFEVDILSIPKHDSVYLERTCPYTNKFYGYVASGTLEFKTNQYSKIFYTGEHYRIVGEDSISSHHAVEDNTVLFTMTFTTNSDLLDFHQDYKVKAEEISMKDGYTSDHCSRIEYLAVETGKQLGVSPEQLRNLSYAGFFHDLGKLKVPLEILQKESSLTPEEWQIIKQHPIWGKEILLAETSITALVKNSSASVATIIEQHHERMDGSGYPFGLKDDEIHIEAYIIGVVDTYDAMTTDRPYRKGLSREIAIAELKELSGKQFPDNVVAAFFSIINED